MEEGRHGKARCKCSYWMAEMVGSYLPVCAIAGASSSEGYLSPPSSDSDDGDDDDGRAADICIIQASRSWMTVEREELW